MNSWTESFNKITGQLDGLINSMGGNAKEYTQVEDQGVQTAAQFMHTLPGFH